MFSKDNEKKEKKPFDSTVCFTVYGSWVEAITDLETEADKDSAAYQLFKAIADYSMYSEEPDFGPEDKILRAIWRVISNEIDGSLKRRKEQFADEGPNEKQVAVIDAFVNNPTASCREIAEALRLSKDFVWRTQRKYSGMIKERLKVQQADTLHADVCSPVSACSPVSVCNSGIAGDSENVVVTAGDTVTDNDGIATRQMRQVRQDSDRGKVRVPILDKILNYLWERHGYGRYSIIEDSGEVDFHPALYYIPEFASSDDDCPF